ncbi:hypothetical protein [Aneurinibacillus uraniidurans]|uniref:hypothetical protein n=1 Tax=Aneurinibacillus uraniidurans TaxID=2966586 RepID=UPI00234B232C|nr:hypothetical protein [Aneurinibacillus sp. B1]WCN39297.1 hypothetical protein PO771_07865 [Aneurinibacillus sp. B1]
MKKQRTAVLEKPSSGTRSAVLYGMQSDAEVDMYRKVRAYLLQNPRANAMQVANATNVSVYKITQFVREGLLRH